MQAYVIGQIIWRMGNEVKIYSAPYELYGGYWQDGTILETGKTITVPVPKGKS